MEIRELKVTSQISGKFLLPNYLEVEVLKLLTWNDH